jgi:undecaprenyl diphosphate synthase
MLSRADDGISPSLAKPPRHVAIIMDGNGRWAKQRSLPRAAGHRKGVETVRKVVKAAGEQGVEYLTLFSFSSENWSRPQSEIDMLMALMKRFIQQDLSELHKNNVRVRVIGARDHLEPEIVGLIEQSEALTHDNTGLNLIVAFNYGAQAEIARAAAKLALQVQSGALDVSEITPKKITGELDTADIPDPDLMIRTSGEQRLSNFLLWQLAYTELVFVDTLWPDFTAETLKSAIEDFNRRERRFGGVTAQVSG